jgi:RNA polymerase sigma-70 factor, ECF subfamily
MYHDPVLPRADGAARAVRPHVAASPDHPFHLQLHHEIPGLQRHAIHMTRNWHRAQDMVQETLVKAWASRDRYVPDTNLRAWLHTILRNTFLSDIRKRRREVEDVDGELAAQLSQPPPQDHAVALSELLAAMADLPLPQREALSLVGAAGFTQEEAADRLGCAIGTIKSRVWRARATLSDVLLPEPPNRARRRPDVQRGAARSCVPNHNPEQLGRIGSGP